MKTGQPILCVNRSDSYCRFCGLPCSPEEKVHKTVLGYSEELRSKGGCGIEWQAITSDYAGLRMKEVCQILRPDLEWVEVGNTSLSSLIREIKRK